MAFDWKAFLALARDLQTQARGAANPESLLRTALSRAYYAAFCHSRNYAQAGSNSLHETTRMTTAACAHI